MRKFEFSDNEVILLLIAIQFMTMKEGISEELYDGLDKLFDKLHFGFDGK